MRTIPTSQNQRETTSRCCVQSLQLRCGNFRALRREEDDERTRADPGRINRTAAGPVLGDRPLLRQWPRNGGPLPTPQRKQMQLFQQQLALLRLGELQTELRMPKLIQARPTAKK